MTGKLYIPSIPPDPNNHSTTTSTECPTIKEETYNRLIRHIQNFRSYSVYEGVEETAEQFHLRFDTVRAIRSQFLQRKVIRHYYVVKARTDRLVAQWKRGSTLDQLARRQDFPPVLLATFVLPKLGYTKRQIKAAIADPQKANSPRLRRELKEAVNEDDLYSPSGHEKQAAEGNRREDLLAVWLDEQDMEYFTEAELREGTVEGKTPDFLLPQPLYFQGEKYNWVESKASFGDKPIHRKIVSGQVGPYVEFYGPGLLVYWYGYLDNLACPGFDVVDRQLLGLA